MDKKDLKKKLDEVIIQIKNNSKDAKFAESLIDKAMSLKGQIDVEEVELIIPKKDVIKRYGYGNSYEFVRCKGGILFHVFGGYKTYVTPNMVAVYKHLEWMLDMWDEYESSDETHKKLTDYVIGNTAIIMESLIVSCHTDESLQEAANAILGILIKLQKQATEAELQEETHKENAKFENDNKMFNQMIGKDAQGK